MVTNVMRSAYPFFRRNGNFATHSDQVLNTYHEPSIVDAAAVEI
jgi:hypothetical protein